MNGSEMEAKTGTAVPRPRTFSAESLHETDGGRLEALHECALIKAVHRLEAADMKCYCTPLTAKFNLHSHGQHAALLTTLINN